MKKYIIVLLISLLFGFNANSKIIKVEANPQKGFYFPYYLKIPKNTDANYLIVESNNTKKSKSLLHVQLGELELGIMGPQQDKIA